jgi:hypothetical protein
MILRLLAAGTLLLALAPPSYSAPSPPAPCGTLDLTSPHTQHCFPEDGSHHFVCCVDINMPENPHSPHGNYNPLERVIRQASNSSSYSWCTCSEEICEEQLGGRVAWNQHGEGWRGYLPRRGGEQPVFNAGSGLPFQ